MKDDFLYKYRGVDKETFDRDIEALKNNYENYDYLHKHLIAEVYFDTEEVLFNKEYRKIE